MVSPLKFKLSSLKPKPSSLGRTNFIPSIAKGRTVITSEVNTYTVELHPTPVPHHLHLFFVATMARLFSRTILKGIVSHSHAMPMKLVGASSFSRYERKWFATVPEDPDSHEDFKPTKKVIDSSSLKDMIEKDVKENPVMIYMKGVPESPGCGFSALAVKVILQYDVPFSARNILEDANLKKSVKAFSNWPTFPQIFINGEFVGGSDIILNMHQSGELKEMLKQFKAKSD